MNWLSPMIRFRKLFKKKCTEKQVTIHLSWIAKYILRKFDGKLVGSTIAIIHISAARLIFIELILLLVGLSLVFSVQLQALTVGIGLYAAESLIMSLLEAWQHIWPYLKLVFYCLLHDFPRILCNWYIFSSTTSWSLKYLILSQ